MARSLGGTLIAVVLGLIAGIVIGAFLGTVFELILYCIVRVILDWLAGVIGSWIFTLLVGLYVGGIIGGVIDALIRLILHRSRWSMTEHPRLWAAFQAAFFCVLGGIAAWIALNSYGITFNGTLEIVNAAFVGHCRRYGRSCRRTSCRKCEIAHRL